MRSVILFLLVTAAATASAATSRPARPNIVLILADDLGFSDLGCYGSEIATPNLDRLAAQGVRFTQFYNAARCCPTRAALMTGRYPHQAGVGHMGRDMGLPAYRGFLNETSITIAEALRAAGYHCLMSGKWHLGEARPHFPIDRGFEHYYGLLGGASSYFCLWPGRRMAIDGDLYRPDPNGFFMTDAITDRAIGYLDDYGRRGDPFFLYVAYTAPHAPLHAPPEDIARYRGKYRIGWDELRRQRYRRMVDLGIIDARWALSPRDPRATAWENVADPDREDLKMAVYAAQIDRMDRGIGRILEKLRALGVEENTLVLFLSDNGGDAEEIDESRPGALPGEPESNVGYGRGWSNVSNTPFRQHKRYVHEGGISTPLIARWPAGIGRHGALESAVGHVIDILPTCLDVAGVPYPTQYEGRSIEPAAGRSLLPLLQGRARPEPECLYWEHEGNRAIRCGQWKLVAISGGRWELYDMQADRTELHDLAGQQPDRVQELVGRYEEFARRWGIRPFDEVKPPGWQPD